MRAPLRGARKERFPRPAREYLLVDPGSERREAGERRPREDESLLTACSRIRLAEREQTVRLRQEELGADDFARERERMVATQLRPRGITDERVLEAMAKVPRERFVPENQRRHAYDDRALSIGEGQTISQPYMVAVMLQCLRTGPEMTALEIGGGSGYQAALLGELCRRVWAVEIVEPLATRASELLAELGYENVEIVVGDGSVGLPERAPYDRIIVAAGAPETPQPLVDQLADGGRLVAPIGSRFSQRLAIVERRGEKTTQQDGIACVFVPLVGEHGWGRTAGKGQ